MSIEICHISCCASAGASSSMLIETNAGTIWVCIRKQVVRYLQASRDMFLSQCVGVNVEESVSFDVLHWKAYRPNR